MTAPETPKSGAGRSSWRALYPADEWHAHGNFVANGIKYVLFRNRVRSPDPPAVVLSFDAGEGVIDWLVLDEGKLSDVEPEFVRMMQKLSEIPIDTSADLLAHPNFGRFG